MTDIDKTKIRRLDFTVLLIFLGLMRHRKAVAVAAELGLTQSAVSHALGRLRDVFGDRLFVRRPHGMEPTAAALALEPSIRQVVDTIGEALDPPSPFDPRSSRTTIRIAAYDNEIASLVPPLIADLRQTAPDMRLVVHALGRQQALAALEDRSVDMALGFIWSLPRAFTAQTLFDEGYRVVARAGHERVGDQLDLETYLACDHLIVSPSGDLGGIVDETLAGMGRSRSVVAALPMFMPALAAVQLSDLVATLPARLVRAHAERFGLRQFEPPLPLRRFEVAMIRHARNERHPLLDWLSARLRDLAGAIIPDG